MSNQKQSRKIKFYLCILIEKFQKILEVLQPNHTPVMIRQFQLLLFRLKMMLVEEILRQNNQQNLHNENNQAGTTTLPTYKQGALTKNTTPEQTMEFELIKDSVTWSRVPERRIRNCVDEQTLSEAESENSLDSCQELEEYDSDEEIVETLNRGEDDEDQNSLISGEELEEYESESEAEENQKNDVRKQIFGWKQ